MTHLRRVTIVVMICLLTASPAAAQLSKDDFSGQDILFYDPDSTSCSMTGESKVTGNDNISKIWNFFITKGLSGQQVAGILGNIGQESGFSPARQEDGKEWGTGGWGIVQWTGARRASVVKSITDRDPHLMGIYYTADYGQATSKETGYAPKNMPIEVNDKLLEYQLDFLYTESTSRTVSSLQKNNDRQKVIDQKFRGKTEWEAIRSASSVSEASDIWLFSFERPTDQSVEHAIKRASLGEALFKELRNSSSNSSLPQIANPSDAPTLTTKIPVQDRQKILETTGMIVKSSYYGGKWMNNDGWYSTNKNQGSAPGSGGSDDPGIGNRGNILAGKAWFAELSNPGTQDFKALGGLPNGTKLQVVYEGKTIVVEKGDIGTGNRVDLKGVDLWWEAAALLNYKGQGDLYIKIVDKNTATTPTPTAKNIGGYYKIDAADGGKASGSIPSTEACAGSNLDASGRLQSLTLRYALPVHKPNGTTGRNNAMPDYVKAADAARAAGRYLGDGGSPTYADCGGFVTTLVVDSGLDPNYNGKGYGGTTVIQKKYLQDNWQKLGDAATMDTSKLLPGDVFIEDGHTFIFVGEIAGFEGKIAEASQNQRVPMAASPSLKGRPGHAGEWYRKK